MLELDIKKRRFIFAGMGKLALLAIGASILSNTSSGQEYVVTSIVRVPKPFRNSNPETWRFYRIMGLSEVNQMTRILNEARNQGQILARKATVNSQQELVLTTRWRSYQDFQKCYSNPKLISALSIIQSRVEVQTLV